MTSLGSKLHDAVYDRLATVISGVPVYYRGQQAETPEYVLFLDDDERYSPEWSDKDGRGNDYSIVLQLWGNKPRTLAERAKSIIDSLYATAISIAGFDFLRVVLEQNQSQPSFRPEGQTNQYSRILRMRFFYHPT